VIDSFSSELKTLAKVGAGKESGPGRKRVQGELLPFVKKQKEYNLK
jgi:hypothetical protein